MAVDVRAQLILCPTAQSPTVAESLHPAFSGVQQYTGRGSATLTLRLNSPGQACAHMTTHFMISSPKALAPRSVPLPLFEVPLSTGPLRKVHSPLSLVYPTCHPQVLGA